MDDEADDESESEEDGRVQEIVEENEEVSNRLMGIFDLCHDSNQNGSGTRFPVFGSLLPFF